MEKPFLLLCFLGPAFIVSHVTILQSKNSLPVSPPTNLSSQTPTRRFLSIQQWLPTIVLHPCFRPEFEFSALDSWPEAVASSSDSISNYFRLEREKSVLPSFEFLIASTIAGL
ncbi:hypothetical protein FN846DRAFT_893441 [Sphaerosporella brunnea]|uniref:Uncharacterized protein n=1 Tax=Sphaerosporella brunnea TaxID=1250544 RepID=A0A5J5EMJ7_9PEZI|nr:hypothetical protein FN846DRAFT_893441 [Sphaerosporella brunnea]